jgi:hypothetical protein
VRDTTGVYTLEHVVMFVRKEGRGSIAIADRRLFEEGGCGAHNLTQPFVRLVEPSTYEVRSIWSGIGTGGRGRGRRRLRRKGRVFEMEKRKGGEVR